MGILSGVYSSDEERQVAVDTFAKTYAEKANNRDALT